MTRESSQIPQAEHSGPIPDPRAPVEGRTRGRAASLPDAGDSHLGATEDQVSDTSPPEGDAFSDEPKQG